MKSPIADAISLIKSQEGFRSTPYQDTEGVWTIGYGFALTGGLTEREACLILEERVRKLRLRLPMVKTLKDIWPKLSETRRDVLISMAYNLGVAGLLTFRNMLQALQDSNYDVAADEMLDSLWASQVGTRADDLAEMMGE